MSTTIISLLYFLISFNIRFSTANPVLDFIWPDLTYAQIIENKIIPVVGTIKDDFTARTVDAKLPQIGNAGEARLPEVKDKKDLLPVRSASSSDFSLDARSGVAIDSETGSVLYSKNADQTGPIASITKLMTALVFLDNNPGWEKAYQIRETDRRDGGKIYLFTGETVKVKDLFYLSLVASANSETIALINSTGMGEAGFVKQMNEKARALGLDKTVFKDAVGLDDANTSTALEVARLTKAAMEKEEIRQATLAKKHDFVTLDGKRKTVSNTDRLLDMTLTSNLKIEGGKTGHTDLAGYCFAGRFSVDAKNKIISAVLGGDDITSRFTETRELASWVAKSYSWR